MKKPYLTTGIWIILALFARLIPHSPNLTPFTSLILLSGCYLSRRQALLTVLVGLLISDFILALITHTAVFGSWTLFTYSGFAAVAVGSRWLAQDRKIWKVALYALTSVLGYWLWTDLGTWLVSGLYPHTLAGLGMCFVMAIPFLQSSAISALVFVPLFFGLAFYADRYLLASHARSAS